MVKTKMPGWKADENTMPERTLRPGFESPSWCKLKMVSYFRIGDCNCLTPNILESRESLIRTARQRVLVGCLVAALKKASTGMQVRFLPRSLNWKYL